MYTSWVEERFRKNIYMENRLYIDEHNSRANRGEHSYFLAMNKFGDLLANELTGVNFKSFIDNLSDESAAFTTPEGFEVPDKVITVC